MNCQISCECLAYFLLLGFFAEQFPPTVLHAHSLVMRAALVVLCVALLSFVNARYGDEDRCTAIRVIDEAYQEVFLFVRSPSCILAPESLIRVKDEPLWENIAVAAVTNVRLAFFGPFCRALRTCSRCTHSRADVEHWSDAGYMVIRGCVLPVGVPLRTSTWCPTLPLNLCRSATWT